MKKYFKIAIVIFCALAATSCMSVYVPPPEGPTAKARIVSSSPHMVFVRTRAEGELRCQQLGSIGSYKGDGDESKLGMLGGDSKLGYSRIERVIAAEKPFTVFFEQVRAYATCQIPISFTPEADAQYEIVHQFKGGKCYAGVNKLTLNDRGEIVRNPVEDTKKMDRITCL